MVRSHGRHLMNRIAPLLLLACTFHIVALLLSRVNAPQSNQFETAPNPLHRLYDSTDLPDHSRPIMIRMGSGDLVEWILPETQLPLDPANITPNHGVKIITSLTQFERLSHRDNVPVANEILELKFLITGIDTESPTLHVMNTQPHKFHYSFYHPVLNDPLIDLGEFNRQTYFHNGDRKNLGDVQ
ncbi:MAG: hypothetical protein ACI8T1_004724 [Verrucomicrobiales bacterium]|jgi:hypothetical protein